MKYYTKEWHRLMQNMNLAIDMQAVPDKEYTDEDIAAFYQKDLAQYVGNNIRLYALMGRSIDVAVVQKDFEKKYQEKCQHVLDRYPAWVQDAVDSRLAALGRLPESVHVRLAAEDEAAAAFLTRVNDAAREELDQQNLPEEAQFGLWMYAANVLSLKEDGSDAALYLRKGSGMEGVSPYVKVTFQDVKSAEREAGLEFHMTKDEDGVFTSDTVFLYDETYRTADGYEVHMLLQGADDLYYMTIVCGDIFYEERIPESAL